ncbi:glycoside hydrolase family 75 protein [Podospora aff. communis PSN243]|uniref:Endo-chitosanase n=1 Tax=Podospora aff. communis PSN243 TaxID=3040156 RepID=A0AAV9GHU6_9PEZI|nr:glycoside hydrolase family 75 protein [Podospora aff. communis PSN243]
MHPSIPKSLALLSIAVSSTLARDVPHNIRALYHNIKSNASCSLALASGFWSSDNGDNSFTYCADHLHDKNIIYIQGTNGALANMDIDCDGEQGGPADDGRCRAGGDTQPVTAFQDVVAGYGKGINDLNANVHPYVVFGNMGDKQGWVTFDPREFGVEPLSVMAVVCGDQLIYGVWGDINGDDGDYPLVGEASISLATACYGDGMTSEHGHVDEDVLYIAFTGSSAVPGADGAKWTATNYGEFQQSIKDLGDTLISRL